MFKDKAAEIAANAPQNAEVQVEDVSGDEFALSDEGEVVSLNTDKGKTIGKWRRKIAGKISEFLTEIKGRILNEEESGIVDVVAGKRKYYHIRSEDLENVVAFLRGSRGEKGANHIMIKHYGVDAQMGYVTAEEILRIGQIIRSGNVYIKNENTREYVVEDPDFKGRKLTVVVQKSKKKKQPDFILTFYSNKKSRSGAGSKQAMGLNPSVLSTSTLNDLQSENLSGSQEKSGGVDSEYSPEEDIEARSDSLSKFPTRDEIKEAERQIEEVRAKYENTPMWLKAPNGQPTKLTERQWLLVRTPNFKRWFGDWETLAIINEVRSMPAVKINKSNKVLTKLEVDEIFRNFESTTNNFDGNDIRFPVEAAAKIFYHKGFDTYSVVNNFRDLLTSARPVFSEKEEIKEGHKVHNNIDHYQHYLNKIEVDGIPYFVRFTVTFGKIGKKGKIKDHIYNELHSSFVSEIYIYNEGANLNKSGETSDRKTNTFIDHKLADFLNSVNEKDVSKVVDENGEPLVVYHGTSSSFSIFDIQKTSDLDLYGQGFYFTSKLKSAKDFSEGKKFHRVSGVPTIMNVFLSLKNPLDLQSPINAKDAMDLYRLHLTNEDGYLYTKKWNDLLTRKKVKTLSTFFEGYDKPDTLGDAEKLKHPSFKTFKKIAKEVFDEDILTIGRLYDIVSCMGRWNKNIFRDWAVNKGFDGLNTKESKNENYYVAFNSNQIKSATDNVGTYSENPDIRWRDVGESNLNKIQNLSDADINAIIDEADKVVDARFKESKARNNARMEADKTKYIEEGMLKWEDDDEVYYNNPDAYSIYKEDDDRYVIEDDGNELDWWHDLEIAKKDALERFWEEHVYDEFEYKDSVYEDDAQDSMRKKFEYALNKIGIEITHSTGGTFHGSQYLYVKLPNGDEKKIRFADHKQRYTADMSVEEDWKAGFKFFVERLQKQDWTEENYPDDIRWKDDGENNLIVSHNISAEKLIMADDIGGLAMPSLGVRRTDLEDTSDFGDISLIAPKSILSDKHAKTYQGDMWSPTYPERLFVAKKGEADRIVDLLQKRYEKAGLDFGGIKWSVYNVFQNNQEPKRIINHLRDLYEAETGKKDFYSDTKWTEEIEEALDVQGEYKLFAGRTNMGRAKLIPETLENVVKLMKKRSLRGDAGAFEGVSSLKAKLIKKLNIKQVSANRDSIKDMETVKAERDKFLDEFSKLVEKLEKVGKYLEKHKSENPFTVLGWHATHIQEMAEEGVDNVNRDFYKGEIPAELKTEIEDFFKRLANSAVPYFESKVARAMRLDEFRGAVIAKDSPERVREILKKNGIKFAEYENESDRKRVTDEFTKELDSGTGNIRWRAVDEWANNSENVEKLADEYLSNPEFKKTGQIIVDPDEIRAKLPNYEVSMTSDFVEAGDKVLEVVWAKALKLAPKDKPVVLLTGNPAAGKGTAKEKGFLDETDKDKTGLIFDAPQNKFSSVEKRVREAIEAGHTVQIIQIYNDPITSWENSIKRGIAKGRFLPMDYFVDVYTKTRGKVGRIENELRKKYGEKLKTKYIDSRENNPIVITPDEALAWDYSISKSQLREIERITDEYRERIEESARLRGDKKNPLAIIGRRLSSTRRDSIRGFTERVSGRGEPDSSRTTQSVGSSESETRLKALLRQERSENPVIWASIVLAREILLGRPITGAKLEKVLPSSEFDGTKRQYAIDRAKLIAEHCKATQEDYINRINKAVQLAEVDIYWNKEVMQEAYLSFRRDGEEYGLVKQRLLDWLKNEKEKKLERVKGLSSAELGIDVQQAIENALQEEPKRKKAEASSEEQEEETSELTDEGIDDGILGVKEKLAPSTLREIVDKIRIGVTKKVKSSGGDEKIRRRVYRNTLVNVLRESAKELAYGKEREAIMKKISELAQKGYAVIKIKEGERAGQKIDNYTLRAEHIALRIFNRGVRDTKKELLEKFEKAVRNIKNPKRIERDDKRKMTGKAQERAKNIKDFARMSAKDLEAEIRRVMDAINKADSELANDYQAHLIDTVQRLEDLQRFGALKEKSRAEMAEAVEWIEKYLQDETDKQTEKVESLKSDADARRKIFLDAINEIKRNAAFDSKLRESMRVLFNSASTFKDLLLGLGRASTGGNRVAFVNLVNKMADDCYLATTRKENEIFKLQEEFSIVVANIYGTSPQTAFKHLLGANESLQKFSVQGKPMSVQIALQRLSMAEQENYRNNIALHCLKNHEGLKQIQEKISHLELLLEKSETDKKELERLEVELEAEKKRAVDEYAESLKAALSPEDLKLLDWFRDFYKRERGSLSDANEAVTGLGIPEVDQFYTPMKMLNEGGTNEKIQVVAIVPKSLTPRIANSRDMDEDIGIVDIWNNRIAENAHYKAFSQLNIEWRGIFAHADFHKTVKAKLGSNVLTQLLDHFNDIMSVKLMDGLKIDTIDKANGLYAIAALGYNFGSGLRQMTGASAFANFIGIKDTIKFAKDCLSKEGRAAAIEILNSETAKRRMSRGNNQALVEALNNIDDNKFWAWYKRNAMIFNRWGDILPIMTIGQGLYRSKTVEYAKTMPIEKAKQRAMTEMWAIAEASQQSPSVMNLGTWQRRGGSFGKAAGLFISSPQLMLSREIEVFNRFNEIRKKYAENPSDSGIRKEYLESRRNLAKTVFINHIFVQGGYMLATVLWKKLLGEDWDDDDWYAILCETIAGPLGGLIVFGRFVSAFYSNYSVSAMPIEGFGRTVMASVDFFQDLITLDTKDIQKDLDRIADSLFSPWRDGSRAYANYTK